MEKNDEHVVLKKERVKKLDFKMKFCLLTACLVLFQLSANSAMSQKKMEFDYDSVPLKRILNEITSQTGYRFFYNVKEIDDGQKISLNVDGENVRKVLKKLAVKANFDFKINENQIVLTHKKTTFNKLAQQSVIGSVTDDQGVPLSGANIVEKGTTNGVIADFDGNFSLEVVNDNAILVVSYIGFATKEVQVTGQTKLNIVLEESAAGLDEVVVVGYGTMKKLDVTGSVSQVDGEELKNMPVRSAADALQGKSSGVMVTSTGGSPGASPAVRIRGVGTVNNNNPLYVVDGLPQTDIGWLNTNDIKSLDILKDASASAIYGTRAANGVIMITTTRGIQTGDVVNSSISFDSYYSFQMPIKTYDMMNASQFIDYKNLANENAGLPLFFTAQEKTQVLQFLRTNFGSDEGTNWWKEINNKNAPVSNYNIAISGGLKDLSYRTSIGYMDQEGIIKGSDYSRLNWRTNFDHDVKDWLKLSGNIDLIHESRRNVLENSPGFNTAFIAFVADPISPVFRDNLVDIPDFMKNSFFLDQIDSNNPYSLYGPILYTNKENPVSQVNISKDNVWKGIQIKGGLAADIKFSDYLKYRGSIGLDVSRSGSDGFNPKYKLDNEQYVTDAVVSKNLTSSNYWVLENTLTFHKRFNEHDLSLLVGISSEETKYEQTGASRQGLVSNSESQRIINAGAINPNASGYKSESSLASYFSRFFYSYKNRYSLTATFRRDGSSNFGEKNKWGNFPSVSAGWVFTEEAIFDNLKWFSNGKLRGSWGQIGNQAIGGGAYRSTYSGNLGYYLFGNHIPYLSGGRNSFGNPDVQWETTEQTDIGLDLSFFDSKFEITADWYIKTTDGMLLQVPLPSYLGYTNNPWANAGKVENKGLELTVSFKNDDQNQFHYTISGNISTLNNKVISLGGGEPILGGQWINFTTTKTEEGMPIGYFYGFRTDGIFQSQQEVDNYFQEGARPGDLKFVDVNHDNKIDNLDRTNIGDPFPDFFYGLNFTSFYKNFDLLVSLQGSVGNDIMNIKKIDMNSGVGWYNAPKDLIEKAWSPTNPGNEQFAINATNTNNLQISDWLVEDGSYMRLKNIQLGYSLPNDILSRSGIQRLRLWLGAYNLWTITNYSGLDPEIGSSSPLNSGVDQGYYPSSKTFMLGIGATF